MDRIILRNAEAVFPDGSCRVDDIAVEGDRIFGDAVSAPGAMEIDLAGAMLFPGFIDIHCHGAVGVDVNEASSAELEAVSCFLSLQGVTGWVPTLVPDSDDKYASAVDAINSALSDDSGNGARILGVHFEGVFASIHRCGALRPEYFRSAHDGFGDLPVPSGGATLMTLAPEIEGGVGLVSDLVQAGWIVAIGHTEAPREILEAACDVGASHVTHLFNAMTGIHHRDPGVAGWAITKEKVTFDIIADGRHVDRAILKMAIDAKRTDGALLISDSVSPTGLGDGEFDMWGKAIRVAGGKATDASGTLSGSVITMLDAVNLCLSIGFSPGQVAQMACFNPARLLQIDSETGSIESGKRADLVAIRNGSPVMTMVGGRVVFKDN